jgi:four helix bundle protein
MQGGTAVSKVDRFEDLIAWKKARKLTSAIYEATRIASLTRDYGLSGQMQRAAVSVLANIAEGYERGSRREFHHFLTIAKASCAEVRSQLYVALDVGYLTQKQFETLLAQAEEVSRIIGGLRTSVSQPRTQRPEKNS